jgi:hypothetical protein
MRGFRNVCVLAIALLSAAGCEGEGGGGDTQVLPGASGTGGGASASGVDAGEGAGPESNNAGGAPAAQTPDALAAPTAQEPDAAPPEPDAAPLPTCEGEAFAAVNERATLEAAGLHYQGLDGEANPMNAVLLDIRDTEGRIGPGLYDLAGTNLADCEVCVAGLKGCNPATGRCQQVFYPKSGVVEITALGAVGEHFTATLHGVEFEEVTVAPNTNRSTPVEGGDTWCNADQVIDLEILPRPVMLGEVVSDFQLQNCGTGEMVSMHELGANAKAMWFVASAGWCSACAQFLPGVFDAIGQIQGQLGADALKPVIIVGEDANYGQPDVAFCRSYADHYGADPNIFYVDHDGTGSFATTFQHIWPYIGPNGEFALPWNALVRGTTFEYFYADRSGESDLNTALNAILR